MPDGLYLGFPGSAVVKQVGLPIQETQERQIWPLGWEDPLKKGMATQSSILTWRIPWTEEPGRLQSIAVYRITKSQT